ncbi:MAG: FkbM family methyltransferase [Gammaproteobacteria bacterium]|jgi:FkbM family methyltransferase
MTKHEQSLGILVIGFMRPDLLQCLLASLAQQEVMNSVHVWIDGTAGRSELNAPTLECNEIAVSFHPRSVRLHQGHLGIEKLMLDGLDSMIANYERIIVLEDDCFPTKDAIESFAVGLDRIANDPTFYSIYGHPFGIEDEADGCTRFQGWGWATTREKLTPILAELKRLFGMSESNYLEFVRRNLTSEVRQRLDITPGRDVLKVLNRFFSWDSATALLSAMRGQRHLLTEKRTIYNCGLGNDGGHFSDEKRFREPPFNMIGRGEVWDYFSPDAIIDLPWFGLDQLDLRIAQHVTAPFGTFVELGAFDGLTQSNTVSFERRGWRGVLIEPVPNNYEKCVNNRPLAQVFNCACTAAATPGERTTMTDVGLMSLVDGTRDRAIEDDWIARGEALQQITSKKLSVPIRTLSDVLREAGISHVDLLSLDVEGGEISVLEGLDLKSMRPQWIVCEDTYDDTVRNFLTSHHYSVHAVLLERAHTRDVLYRDLAQVVPRLEVSATSKVNSVTAQLEINRQRVLGPDNSLFDLSTRFAQTMDENIHADLKILANIATPFNLRDVDHALADPSGDKTMRLAANGWFRLQTNETPSHTIRSLAIETCTSCVGNCVFCPVSENPHRRPVFMDMALFDLILDRIGDVTLRQVALNIYTEPLLHPDFIQQVTRVAAAGHPLALFTTGSLLTNAIADHLADVHAQIPIAQIVINLPSLDPEHYRHLMGVKLSPNLISYLSYAANLGLPLNICVNGITESAERSAALIKQLREQSHEGLAPQVFENYTHSRAGAASGAEIHADLHSNGKLRGCRRVVEDVTVNIDGKIILCCQDFHQKYVLGDLREQSLNEVLNGDVALKWRRQIFGLDVANDDLICHKCAEAWRDKPGDLLPQTQLI